MKKVIYTVLAVMFTATLTAQTFDLSAEIRPRYESRNGYNTLQTTDADGANFISQRTRLNFGYKNKRIKAYVSMQNVRVWGDVSTLSSDDNATALHEAWGEVAISNKVSFRIGRQEIVYDDSRIFGNVGWAQQARSHDAFVVKHVFNKKHKLDVGLALNADGQARVDNYYSNAAGYKDFQYAWYHGNFDKLGVSFLLLNTGIEYLENEGLADEKQVTDHMQTVGPRVTYKANGLSANGAVYFQTGKKFDTNVSSLYYTANVGYKINDDFKVALGYEYLSGKDQDDVEAGFNSFAPLFGTNHKFNGWMDYFYVGNHGNSVGLRDINATFVYKTGKFSAKLIPHLFSAAADVYDSSANKMSANLGTEIDLTIGYKVAKDITISAGYSKMFASDTMERIKVGGDKDERNCWSWVMFTFKPKLFTHTVK